MARIDKALNVVKYLVRLGDQPRHEFGHVLAILWKALVILL